jgi:hypothetical protein
MKRFRFHATVHTRETERAVYLYQSERKAYRTEDRKGEISVNWQTFRDSSELELLSLVS